MHKYKLAKGVLAVVQVFIIKNKDFIDLYVK